MKTKFTITNLKKHLTYHWWKYVVAAALAAFVIDMLFIVTSYRSPEDKKIELLVSGYTNDSVLDAYMRGVHESEFPDMEVVSADSLIADEMYGAMVLQTRMAAHEGDVFILPREDFQSYSSVGYFVALDEDAEFMALIEEKGINAKSGWRTIRDEDTGVVEGTHLYGIPVSQLPSLVDYAIVEDGYVCISVVNGNDAVVMKFMKRFISDMAEPWEEPQSVEMPAADK